MFSASIAVIARNEEKKIGKCIESLLRQTLPCEIIVVDGNSTDGTRDVVRQFPVKLVQAPLRDSYGISRNLGVKNAGGEVILFQDADDVVESSWSEKLVGHFDSKVGIVIARRTSDPSASWYHQLQSAFYSAPLSARKAVEASWTDVTTKGSAFSKKAILESGGFDDEMFFGTEDKELAYRILERGYRIIYDPSVVVKCTPTSSVKEYMSDNFYREGMGHGYVSRKHGVYRPSYSGIGSLVLILLSVLLVTVNTQASFFTFLLSTAIQYKLIVKSVLACKAQNKPHLILPFFLLKWLERLLQFVGFSLGYFIPVKTLRVLRDRFKDG